MSASPGPHPTGSFLARAAAALVPAMAALAAVLASPSDAAPVSSRALREVLVSSALLGTSFALDRPVGTNYPDRGASFLLEEPGETFGSAPFLLSGTAGLGAGGLVLHKPPLLRTAKELGLALGAATASAALLKTVTRRKRPDGSDLRSFPSGHATAAFAVATVLDRELGTPGKLAYLAAGAAGYARMADGRHYLSDVVAGMLLGRLVGHLVLRHDSPPPPAAEVEPDSPR